MLHYKVVRNSTGKYQFESHCIGKLEDNIDVKNSTLKYQIVSHCIGKLRWKKFGSRCEELEVIKPMCRKIMDNLQKFEFETMLFMHAVIL